ncbi:MAG: hypothetical protein RL199_2459 [Pseudomonadota bacterium]|jgi:urease beta subunit
MRTRILALGLLSALVAACDCGGRIQKSKGILQVSPQVLDFGTACINGTLTGEVVVENGGNGQLADVEVKVSGSAFSLVSEAPAVIEPGERLVLQVGFTPPADGDFAGAVEVKTDAGTERATLLGSGFDGPRQEFIVLCERTPGVGDFDEDRACAFLDFGRPLYDTTVERTARLANRGCAPVTVSDLSLRPEAGSTTPDDAKLFSLSEGAAPLTVSGRTFIDVKVRFSAPKNDAVPAVDLHVATDDPKNADLTVSLLAFPVGPSLVVNPPLLTFFDAVTGSTSTKTFTVTNAGGSPMQVDAVTLAVDAGSTGYTLTGADAPFTLAPATARTVSVVYAPTGNARDAASVTVTAGQESAAVKLLGGTQPLLNVTWLDGATEKLPPVDFGRVATGAKGIVRTVRLKNDGSAPLLITSIELPSASNPGASYKLVGGTPNRLEPGTTADLTVSFDDVVKLRDDGAKLRIVSNDAVYADAGGEQLVDLISSNDPNFDPVPGIQVVSCPQGVAVGDTRCEEPATLKLDWELTVDGSASTGPEMGDTLSYQWTFGSIPPGSTVRFETPDGEKTRIVSNSGTKVDLMGRYIVKLVVTDQFGNRSAAGTQVIDVSR